MEDIDYPDAAITSDMMVGFPLCGWMRQSNVFPSRVRPPEIKETFLRTMAGSISSRTIAATVSSGDAEADLRLWQAIMDEVQAGFLTGPWSADRLGRDSVVCGVSTVWPAAKGKAQTY